MKRFNHHKLAILPLLGILAMSPSVIEKQFTGRQIASVVQEVKGHPKYEALVSKVDPKAIMKDVDINVEKFKVKRDELSVKLKKEKEEFKKDQSDKLVVEEQRKKVEGLVIDVLLVEGSLKDLQEKKGIEQADDEASLKILSEAKDVVEGLLTDLEANEVLVAKASEPKAEEPKVEEPKKDEPVVAEEPKKEEPKAEEPKKEETPVVAEKEEKEEVKKEEDKKEEKKEVCEAEEKNKVLTAQIEDLLKQQNQIMQTLVGMAQMMVNMHQQNMSQQQQQPQQPFQYPNQMAYQYQQPMTAGNWVYYPQGFQPSQPNIFAQQPQQPQQQGGFYPDQLHMQQQRPQQQWGMQPQNYFADPRYNAQPVTYGSFGNEPFSFQMSGTPTLSMM